MSKTSSPLAAPSGQPLLRNVKVLGLASLLNDTASEMIFPLLPNFLLTVLLGNRFYLGIIEGAADSVASLLKLWSGGRSDQAGRCKGFVLFGYSLAAVTRPLIGVIVAPWQLFVVRVGDRIGKGVRTSPRDALIADSTDPSIRGRAFGFHRAMDHLGAALGPLLAAGFLWLWPGELRTLIPAHGAAGAAGHRPRGLWLAGDGNGPAGEGAASPDAPAVRPQLPALPGPAGLHAGQFSDAFLLVRARELGVPTALLPLLRLAFHVVKSTSNLLLGRAVDRFGPRPFLFLGWLLYAGVYLAFGLATTAWEAWAFFLVYALFYGLTEPAEKTLVADLVGGERKGLAYGWYNCAIGIATLPASLIFGAVYQVYGGGWRRSPGEQPWRWLPWDCWRA